MHSHEKTILNTIIQREHIALNRGNNMENKVINKYEAIIKGKTTGLAGCNNTTCTLDCIRKDANLAFRVTFLNDGISNGCFIAR